MIQSIEKVLVPIDDSEPGFQAAWMAFTIAWSVGASWVHGFIPKSKIYFWEM